MTRIITIYIAVDGSRQLNLSDRERTAVLHALQHTTHPSALRAAFTSAEFSLRRQAHPNFIRWTICNGNRPRVIFARGLGISLILLGIVADLLITLSSVGRAWRVLPIASLMLGVSTLIAAWKGMCVVLHGMHHRHLRPWELFADPEDASMKTSSEDSLINPPTDTGSYEDEPWVRETQYHSQDFRSGGLDSGAGVEADSGYHFHPEFVGCVFGFLCCCWHFLRCTAWRVFLDCSEFW
jgi:hypothetical protein